MGGTSGGANYETGGGGGGRGLKEHEFNGVGMIVLAIAHFLIRKKEKHSSGQVKRMYVSFDTLLSLRFE